MVKHRRGSLTSARERAKSILKQMPFGTRVVVGQWIDNGEYEAKTGSGGGLHDRFRQVELWTSTPYKTKPGKKMVKLDIKAGRRNPSRGKKTIPEYMEIARQQKKIGELERMKRRSGLTGGTGKKSAKASRTPRDYGRNPKQGAVEYTLKPTHISRVNVGDTILHEGKLRTLAKSNIKRDFMGKTIWGDSYKLGNEPVMVAQIKHAKPKKSNPSRGTRWRMDDGQIVTTDQLKRKFMGKLPTPTQRRMLGIRKAAPVKKSATKRKNPSNSQAEYLVACANSAGNLPASQWKKIRANSANRAAVAYLNGQKGIGARLKAGEVIEVHVSGAKITRQSSGVPMVTTVYSVKKEGWVP